MDYDSRVGELGICRLCRNERKLCVSHFMPAALYRTGKTMAWATDETAGVAPREIKDYLLCDECEGRFSKRGESPVLSWIEPNKTGEPLPVLARLEGVERLTTVLNEFDVYPCSMLSLDPEPFAYFALSLAWRSAIHEWTLPAGNKTEPFAMGAYEEPVRLYLLGQAPYPADAVVLLTDAARERVLTWCQRTAAQPASPAASGTAFLLTGSTSRCG